MEPEKQSREEAQNTSRKVNWFMVLMVINIIGLILVFAGITLQAQWNGQSGFLIQFPSDITPVTVFGDDTANSGLDSQQAVGHVHAQVGQPAPDFTLRTLEGDEVSLSDFRGQPVLINFWATWCAPCRLEMPELVHSYNTHREEGFVILAVNLTHQDSIEEVEAFVEEFEMDFPVLLDETGTVADELYHLFGLPMSVFVNREGIITHTYIGIMGAEQLEQFVDELTES